MFLWVTLYTLDARYDCPTWFDSTQVNRPGKEHWTVKAIAWLMVQIWFGNTYLSFGQAESFHPM